MALWPAELGAKTRDWFEKNILSGTVENLALAVRSDAESEAPAFEMGFGYRNTNIRVAPDFPLLREAQGYGVLQGTKLTFVVENGHMQSPFEGRVDLAGTSFQVPDMSLRPAKAQISLRGSGQAEDVIGIVALPPVNALAGSTLAPDFVAGDVALWGEISYPMVPDKPKGSFRYDVSARISSAASTELLPGKTVTANEIDVVVTNDGVTVGGPMRVGKVLGNMTWAKAFGEGAVDNSRLSGFVALGPDLVEEFSLGLPDGMFTGQGSGQLEVALKNGEAPDFRLTSSMEGLVVAVPEVGFRKPAEEAGSLLVEGRFSAPASVRNIVLKTRGMDIDAGAVALSEDGTFADAQLDGVRVGTWFEGAVALTSRGKGVVPRISILGGSLDLSGAQLGQGNNAGGGGPIEVSLDDVRISSGIRLTNLQGELDTRGGLSGRFGARVNGGAAVQGQLESVSGGVAARITSGNGGRVLSDAGIFTSASGGQLDMTLQPRAQGLPGYTGRMVIKNVNVKRAPVLTELLSAVSIVGLLDQMRGAGIVFTDVEALFDIDQSRARIRRSSAVGPSLGVSLDGTYSFADARLAMQGVVSPVYFLNAIGQAISPRRGEGLFGFNFNISGTASKPKVSVNPLSILTPGGFRDIFRAQPPKDSN